MNSEQWRSLLDRSLQGDALTDDEVATLVRVLSRRGGRDKATEWFALGEHLWARFKGSPDADLVRSRERLLGKVLLREKAARMRSTAEGGSRKRLTYAVAAIAAMMVLAMLGFLLSGSGYSQPAVSGDFRITGAPVEADLRARRGDRIVVGEKGAKIALGGYCGLTLDAGAEAVLMGRPWDERVHLKCGRMISDIVPDKGDFTVLTPLGRIEVTGTEFVTAVERSDVLEGEHEEIADLRKTVVVTVRVLSGAVTYDFGDESGVISSGTSMAFSGDEEGGGRRRDDGSRVEEEHGEGRRDDDDDEHEHDEGRHDDDDDDDREHDEGRWDDDDDDDDHEHDDGDEHDEDIREE